MRIGASAAALLSLLIGASSAGAVSFSLGGAGGAAVHQDAVGVLYASGSNAAPVMVAAVGRSSPDGSSFSELGVPSMSADGRVLFSAETITPEGVRKWDIFMADPKAPARSRVERVLSVKPSRPDCTPYMKGDGYPVADADGAVAFFAGDGAGHDALFMYADGAVSCLVRAGEQTNEGHKVSVLSIGTAQTGEPGQVVFNAWLRDEGAPDSRRDRQALLMASREGGVSELAVEGELGPNRTRYSRPFGLPAVLPSPEGTLVAFTAKTESGSALFLYRNGMMARILPTGTTTPIGPVTYLSPGRPGLSSDGTTAVLAGCARVPAIFRLARGRLNLRIQRGQVTALGTELVSLGDPALTASGAILVGATDSENEERLYELDPNNAFFEIGSGALVYKIALHEDSGPGHSIFTGTLTVNQHGDFAYLGGR